ncbi:MAG: hypothetical protein ACERIH_11460 [Labilibaculum antarcticum]
MVSVTLPRISVIDIEPAGDINLLLENSSKPGTVFHSSTNSSKWLNYTSSLSRHENSKRIAAQLSGVLPDGIELIVIVKNCSTGRGQMGISSGEIKLSEEPQVIISGVGACYTGNGEGNGHNLEYRLLINAVKSISSNKSNSILVTYTISE